MYFLGLTYDKQGDKQKALEQFQKISDLNPDNADVKKIVANLQAGKNALDGLDQNTAGQNPNGDTAQNQPSIQRDQQPVPPNTPIGPTQDQNPAPTPNPVP